MKSPASVGALLAALGVLFLAGAFVWLRLATPYDGARLEPGQPVWMPDGLVVTPLEAQPGGLRAGDVVVAVDGRSMEAWARGLFAPDEPRPRWDFGQTLTYTVLREGRRLEVPVSLGRYPLGAILAQTWGTVLFALVSQLVGAFVFVRRPGDRAARALLLWASGILSATSWSLGLQVSDLVGGVGFWLFKATTFGAYMLFWIAGLHFALVFPRTHPVVSRRPWVVPFIYLVPYACYPAYLAATWPGAASTLDWLGRWIPGESVLALVYLASTVVAIVSSYRASRDAVVRQKVRWVVFAALVSGGGSLVLWLLPSVVLGHPIISQQALGLLVLPFPLALAVAILRHRLFDIDLVLNRTLVYGALTASIVSIYVLIVGLLGALLHASGDPSALSHASADLALSLVAAGLVAVLFQPLRERLQRGVNRLLYGERDDPYAVLSRLGQRLEATLAPEAVLSTIVETVAQALKLPYAAIALKQGEAFEVAAAYGDAPSPPLPPSPSRGEGGGRGGRGLALPLVYQKETLGQLLLAPRAPGEPFTTADRRLLDDLARQAGVAAHAVRLTADLQRSRERLVAAREEERRRLRRDLHDGLGPALASLSLKLEAARNLLARDPAATDALLAELKTQTQAAIADIRRLVYDLRPPALDQLGLVSALRERAAQYGGVLALGDRPGQANGLYVSVEAPEALPPAWP